LFLTPDLQRLWGKDVRWLVNTLQALLPPSCLGRQPGHVGRVSPCRGEPIRATSTGRKHLRILHLLFKSVAKVTLSPQVYSNHCPSKANGWQVKA
jgi:hypothetical protein